MKKRERIARKQKNSSNTSQREKSEETRRIILQAARSLFLKNGYRVISTREVTDACGLTHPALYHYFAGKEDLYVAVILDELARLRAGLEHIAQRDKEPLVEQLRRTTLFLLVNTEYEFTQMQHDIAYELSPGVHAALEEAFSTLFVPLANIFAAGQQSGAFQQATAGGLKAEEMGVLLLGLVSHFRTFPPHSVESQSQRRLAALADLIVQLLLQGIAAS